MDAFDMKDLVARLEKNGLHMVEQEAKDATQAIFGWLQESLAIKGGLLAMLGSPVIALIEPMALKAEDKIDGVDGN